MILPKREKVFQNIFLIKQFTNFIKVIMFVFVVEYKKLISSSNFEFFNELLINNGFVIKDIEIQGTKYLNKDDILKVSVLIITLIFLA